MKRDLIVKILSGLIMCLILALVMTETTKLDLETIKNMTDSNKVIYLT
jgi:hypothetical protein